MFKIGDKIKYVRPSSLIECPLGTICTVTNIKNTAIEISGDYKVNGNIVGKVQGVMSYDEYEKYFDKSFETVHEWTDWTDLFDDVCTGDCVNCNYNLLCLLGDISESKIQYKHNGKRLVMKFTIAPNKLFPQGKVIRVYANCSPIDTFDVNVGIRVALLRLEKKLLKEKIKFIEDELIGLSELRPWEDI